jgi:hypothetical protein
MMAVASVQDQVEQRTGKQEEIREHSEYMRPVFGQEEKPQNNQKAAYHEPPYQLAIHLGSLLPADDQLFVRPYT